VPIQPSCWRTPHPIIESYLHLVLAHIYSTCTACPPPYLAYSLVFLTSLFPLSASFACFSGHVKSSLTEFHYPIPPIIHRDNLIHPNLYFPHPIPGKPFDLAGNITAYLTSSFSLTSCEQRKATLGEQEPHLPSPTSYAHIPGVSEYRRPPLAQWPLLLRRTVTKQ
jgi:hypothetical protein